MAAPPERVHHPMFALIFGLGSRWMVFGEARERTELVEDLFGRVIEVGCGAGVNFGFYPPNVTEVLAVEPERHLRKQAEKAAAAASVPVTVVDGMGERLPAEDATFDAGVVSLVLCTIQNPPSALAELMRVIKPGGELRYYEHVVAEGRAGATIQKGLDATIWPRVAGGCHCARDTAAAILDAGFLIESERRLALRPLGLPLPVTPQVIGIARRP
jgi:ubiquinone/menaquinone biosynthesis C-methylase UbiE